MQVPKHIAEQLRIAIADLDPDGHLPDARGASYGALPLLADLGGCWFLRADGVFLEVRWDENEDRPEMLNHTPVAALVVGAERYPWLRELIPARPANAIDCPDCGGVGKVFVAGIDNQGFLCAKCNVLGWAVPSGG